jgi:uroporphyrinogen III methyltransferase/synthase
MEKIRVGSRESALAVAQAEIVLTKLRERYDAALITMKTTGDRFAESRLDALGGKGVFVKELDRALFERKIDLAVHSLKDVPTEIPAGIGIGAYTRREDPRDALVLAPGSGEPDFSAPLGCGSPRRRVQAARLFPSWRVADIRGNVLTRLAKLDAGRYGGLILSLAGLKRLGLGDRAVRVFEPEEMLPAAGQGVLAVTARDREAAEVLALLDDPESRLCSLAERSFIKTLDGGCAAPVAVYAVITGDTLALTGLYAPEGAAGVFTGSLSGPKGDAVFLGNLLALRLSAESRGKQGRVWLVGAGPGDPGLLTLTADRVLGKAEAVLFDSLVGKGVLSRIPPEAELVYVGKRAGNHALDQETINRILAEKAAAGKLTVRLKGGDPFLFGRGGEELARLKALGIPFEVVPGIPSALAAPAYAGIPVSHRDCCSAVHIITARHGDGAYQRDIDYDALVRAGGTLVFLMGAAEIEAVRDGLLRAGLSPDTPGAVVARGTTAEQQVVRAPLSALAATPVPTPALIIIGAVCGLAPALSWAESKPLSGVRVAVTRPLGRGGRLHDLLSEQGAEVVCLPTIETVPLPSPGLAGLLENPSGWLAFTSPVGVGVFFGKLREAGRDIRTLAGFRFAAIGSATAAALEDRGIRVDLMPDRFTGADLGRAIARAATRGEQVILPRSRIGTRGVIAPLLDAGLAVRDVPVYDTRPFDRYRNAAYRELLLENLRWVAFTSASTAEGFAAAFGPDGLGAYRALCIGEETAKAAARYGMETLTAPRATLESMVETLLHKRPESRL